MKKIIAVLCIVTLLIAIGVTFLAGFVFKKQFTEILKMAHIPVVPFTIENPATATPSPQPVIYEVYVDSSFAAEFNVYGDALTFARNKQRAAIKEQNASEWLWDNYPSFSVFLDKSHYTEFDTFAQAVAFAKTAPEPGAYIYYRKNHTLIWASDQQQTAHQIHGVPLMMQRPELPKGCEVTSLAMVINYCGVTVDKMELAEAVAKDPAPLEEKNGQVYWGNPNVGFVGEMTSDSPRVPGFGVYHKPIHALLTQYFPNSAVDLTGCEFEDLLAFINNDSPVWVITNATYAKLPESAFVTWQSDTGEVRTTYQEHAVVITGYDAHFVYFNDPLGNATKAPKTGFIEAWVQMGRQAVAVSK